MGSRVLIVDDHRLFADAIRPLLEEDGMEVLPVASSGRAALESARAERPDLVLLDLGLPDEHGLAVGRKILEACPEARVVAVTALSHPRVVREVLGAGFHGYLTKDTPLPRFVSSIREALDGKVVSPQRLHRPAPRTGSPEDRDALLLGEQLTPRERDVLALLVEGRGSKEIAGRLSVSPNTVRTHVQSILTKLHVHSRLEAAAFAVRHRIVPVNRNYGSR